MMIPGVYFHLNGDVYDGEFIDNEMDGLGTYTKARERSVTGASLSHCFGSYIVDGFNLTPVQAFSRVAVL
jgi:hypothetical protein